MGATRVTPKEAVKMILLYDELGTYAAVGRKVGRSGSTVKKFVTLQGVPKSLRIVVLNEMKKIKGGSFIL